MSVKNARTRVVLFRVTPEEYASLEARAVEAHSISDYLRDLVLNQSPDRMDLWVRFAAAAPLERLSSHPGLRRSEAAAQWADEMLELAEKRMRKARAASGGPEWR